MIGALSHILVCWVSTVLLYIGLGQLSLRQVLAKGLSISLRPKLRQVVKLGLSILLIFC